MAPAPRCYMISRDELQRCMLDSACNVFSVMADISLQESLEFPEDARRTVWVNALVGFEGSCSGLLALYCSESLARRVTSALLGSAAETDIQEVLDALGEVVNILGGDMKLYLDRGGRQVSMSIPMVFIGDSECKDEFMLGADTVCCTMAAGDERLLIGMQITKNM